MRWKLGGPSAHSKKNKFKGEYLADVTEPCTSPTNGSKRSAWLGIDWLIQRFPHESRSMEDGAAERCVTEGRFKVLFFLL